MKNEPIDELPDALNACKMAKRDADMLPDNYMAFARVRESESGW